MLQIIAKLVRIRISAKFLKISFRDEGWASSSNFHTETGIVARQNKNKAVRQLEHIFGGNADLLKIPPNPSFKVIELRNTEEHLQ
jgi:hypothetical protein